MGRWCLRRVTIERVGPATAFYSRLQPTTKSEGFTEETKGTKSVGAFGCRQGETGRVIVRSSGASFDSSQDGPDANHFMMDRV